ncbi:MAG: LytR/AlgR family response regulator transcription factor [Faecalibacterium sp.]
MKVAIVEDDAVECQRMREHLRSYAQTRGLLIEAQCFVDGEEIIRQGTGNLDIILMDIQMQKMDGMTAARLIRETNSRVVLIFVTSMVTYALQGYRVDALDFLVKPVEYSLLQSALDRAGARLEQTAPHYINVRIGKELHHVDIRRLLYAEAQDHKLLLQTEAGPLVCAGSIRALEKALEPESFFRCHAAFLVNLDRVERLDGSDVVLGEHRVPVSKHRRKQLLEQLAACWGAAL